MSTAFIPKWIAWETTRRCNLNCIHCRCASTEAPAAEELDTDAGKQLLSAISEFCSPVVVLSGGEPLLRRDIFDLAEYGTSLGLRMCLATNGLLVSDQACLDMKRTGIRMVSLSLDGSTAASHDDFRQSPGAFDSIVAAAQTLRRNNISFLINSSFTRRNQHDIAATFRLARQLGATAWYMFMIVPTGRAADILEELIPPDEYEAILDWHYQQEKQTDDMLMRPTCAPHYYRIVRQKSKAEGIDFRQRSLSFATGSGKGCIAAQSICLIDSSGNVKPCSYFSRSAGNIKETPFREIWDNAPLFRELRDFSTYTGKCGVCEYLSVCGGCRARAEAINGDYMAEEPYCNYIPLKLRPKG
ncbi:MAG TPA: radical SAM protein [Deltaproteobacteria bacterium]|nr:radical SAM protein [Deltaproteobacteria bacterium]HQB40028.1 radical SAM protein [Deltaproteobacteria bacterium]